MVIQKHITFFCALAIAKEMFLAHVGGHLMAGTALYKCLKQRKLYNMQHRNKNTGNTFANDSYIKVCPLLIYLYINDQKNQQMVYLK